MRNYSSSVNTNVGVGNTSGVPGDVTDNDGARGIGRITLGTDVSKSGGTTVNVGSTTYYYAGAEIALGHSREGYTFVEYNSSDVIISGSSFTMPANDVTVTATWTPADIINVTANKPTARSDYWATFYHPEANYAVPTDITIYKGKIGSGSVELTDATGNSIIPAGQAVVLNYSDVNISSPITLTKTATDATGNYTENDLKGGATVADGYTVYTLADGSHGVGFYKYNGSGLSSIKAHLEIPSTVGSRSFYGFDDNTTAISAPESHASTELNGTWYTLEGRKLQGVPTRKGLYIVNGKKVVIK